MALGDSLNAMCSVLEGAVDGRGLKFLLLLLMHGSLAGHSLRADTDQDGLCTCATMAFVMTALQFLALLFSMGVVGCGGPVYWALPVSLLVPTCIMDQQP